MIKMTNNPPIYKINGKFRRELKKTISKLKYHKRMFPYYQDLNEVCGGNVLTEEECENHLKAIDFEINNIEEKLSEKL